MAVLTRPQASRRLASNVLFTLSALLGWFILYLTVLSGLQFQHAQHELYGELRTELADARAPTGSPIELGRPVALISAADAGIDDLVVVEGTRTEQLQRGAGHLSNSVLPGQRGTSVVMGKSTTFGAPFRHADRLERGSIITAITAQGEFRYAVIGVRVKGDLVPPAPAEGRLTLVTSEGGLTPSQTIYVDADLVGAAVTAGPVGATDPWSTPMRGRLDGATLAYLVLALELLAAGIGGFVWAWARWSRQAAWIVGAPVVCAALWVVSSLTALLLPGLI